MNYSEKLAALKRNPDVLLKEIGDEWRTPDKLYWGAFQLYGPFVLDLFSDGDNAKCATYYTAEDNALTQPWAEFLDGGTAFANPPYSRSSYDDNGQPTTGMRHIIAKAEAEREKGARVVFLIKAAPSESWWPEHADHVCWIKGRVGFELPLWAQHLKASSAGFGQAIVVFDKNWRGERERYIARDVLERQGQQLIDAIEQRAEQLAADMMRTQAPALPQELEPVPPEFHATDTDDGTTELERQEVALELELYPEQPEPDPEPITANLAPLTIEPEPEPEPEQEQEQEPQTEFTPEDLHQKYWSGELSADSLYGLITFLVGMFGRRDKYNIKQVQIASVAAAGSSIAIDGLDKRQTATYQVVSRVLEFEGFEGPDEQVAAAEAIINEDAKRLAETGNQRQLSRKDIRWVIRNLPKGQKVKHQKQQAEAHEA